MVKNELGERYVRLKNDIDMLQSESGLEGVEDTIIQELTELLLKIYAQKVESSTLPPNSESRVALPLGKGTKISDTEVMLFVDKLLESKQIDLFEVQMFRSLCINN